MSKMIRREKYDPTRDFVVRKPFTIFGKRVTPGQPFDKLLLSERRIRQMYDQYMVDHAPVTALPGAGLTMSVTTAPVADSIPEVVTELIAQPETVYTPPDVPLEVVPLTRSERVRAAKRINRQAAE